MGRNNRLLLFTVRETVGGLKSSCNEQACLQLASYPEKTDFKVHESLEIFFSQTSKTQPLYSTLYKNPEYSEVCS